MFLADSLGCVPTFDCGAAACAPRNTEADWERFLRRFFSHPPGSVLSAQITRPVPRLRKQALGGDGRLEPHLSSMWRFVASTYTLPMFQLFLAAECYDRDKDPIVGDGACFFWAVDAIQHFSKFQTLRTPPSRLSNEVDRDRIHQLAESMLFSLGASSVRDDASDWISHKDRLTNFIRATAQAVSSCLSPECWGTTGFWELPGLFSANTTFTYWIFNADAKRFKLSGYFANGCYTPKNDYSLEMIQKLAGQGYSGLCVLYKTGHYTVALDAGLPLLGSDVVVRFSELLPSLYANVVAIARSASGLPEPGWLSRFILVSLAVS